MNVTGPLSHRYGAAVLLVLTALCPYLVLSSAVAPLEGVIGPSLGLSPQALSLSDGMANAAYAIGTVLALALARRYPPRRLLVGYAALFLIGSVLAAGAVDAGMFVTGHILQGFATSLMLIAAIPPLAVGWPARRYPTTAVVLGLGIFAAVAAGPVFGGVQAGAGDWRLLFWIVAGVGALALLMAILTFKDQQPSAPESRFGWVPVCLAGIGAAGIFFGTAELTGHSWLSPLVIAPLAAGVVLIVVLLVHQYVAAESLLPVRTFVSTIPLFGTVIAMTAAAASVGAIELIGVAIAGRGSPTHNGVLFLPQVAGAVITAFAFGALVRTRWVPGYTLGGMVALAGGAAVGLGVATGPDALVLVGSGLMGLGVGASVVPAMTFVGFAVPPWELQPVYALLELLRGVAAFAVAPILLHVATSTGSAPAEGIRAGLWVGLVVAAVGALAGLAIILTGRPRHGVPNIDEWLGQGTPALASPPLAARIRPGAARLPAPAAATPEPNSLVRGRVVITGDPASPAVLTLVDGAGREIDRTRTEPDGSYQLAAPRAGTYLLAYLPGPDADRPRADWVRVGGVPVTHDIA